MSALQRHRGARRAGVVVTSTFVASAFAASLATAESTTTATTTATTPPASRARSELFQGFVVAQNATDHYAPEFVFRVSGWSSDWGGRKLVELVPDGQRVKQGELVARFEFGAEQALQHINERIARTEAAYQQTRIGAMQTLETLEMALRRKRMDEATARLNLQKAPSLSANQAAALAIQLQLAEFDVTAAEQLLASARTARDAAVEHASRERDAALAMRARYDFYVDRFTVRAAHDGVVRHAFHPRERRKLQKGDGVQAGMRVVSVARDDALAVRFFIPEARAVQVRAGQAVRVQVPTSAEEVEGVVDRIEFFPVEIGFLLENDALPNAREKAVQVRATLTGTGNLAAGTEVRVRLVATDGPR
jgi:hypothetical protein